MMDDSLVSRQAAISIVEFECGEWKGLARTIVNGIKKIPSAQPEIIRCKDCKYRDADDFCTGRGYPNVLVPDDGFCDKGERRTG